MTVGCNTLSFAAGREDAEAVAMLAMSGFKSIDLNLNKYSVRTPVSPFWSLDGGGLSRYMETLAKTAEECGVIFGQLHSPYPTFFADEDKVPLVQAVTRRSIFVASALHSPYLVVHPNVPPAAKTAPEVEAAVEDNFKFFSAFFDDLKRHGVCIGIENMFNWDRERDEALPTVASTAECMVYMIDRLNGLCGEQCFVACLDTGHAMLTGGGDPAAMVKKLGSRLKLMHLHDNDAKRDYHRLPFTGEVDWAALAASLAEIGYDGVLSLEIKTDGSEADSAYAAARKFNEMVEKEKKAHELHS